MRNVRIAAWGVFVLAFAAMTWPGLLLVNRVDPRVLGLPFHMAWFAFWILAVFVVLWIVDRVETRLERAGDD